ncbi:MAG: GTPase, partial [bacterium]|nr:GTPase [bacterium]
QGSLKGVFAKYNHLTDILPAMGYGRAQMADLQASIAKTPCDAVIVGTPIDLAKLIEIKQPNTRVTYELAEHDRNALPEAIKKVVG